MEGYTITSHKELCVSCEECAEEVSRVYSLRQRITSKHEEDLIANLPHKPYCSKYTA